MVGKGYRDGTLLDPGTEPLHPIFTRTVSELVDEQRETELLPEFWRKRATVDTTDRDRRPGITVPVLCAVRNALALAIAYSYWNDPNDTALLRKLLGALLASEAVSNTFVCLVILAGYVTHLFLRDDRYEDRRLAKMIMVQAAKSTA